MAWQVFARTEPSSQTEVHRIVANQRVLGRKNNWPHTRTPIASYEISVILSLYWLSGVARMRR